MEFSIIASRSQEAKKKRDKRAFAASTNNFSQTSRGEGAYAGIKLFSRDIASQGQEVKEKRDKRAFDMSSLLTRIHSWRHKRKLLLFDFTAN
jgi:hypothetical protein